MEIQSTNGSDEVVESSCTQIERVVRQLNTIGKTATFEFAHQVGKLIVDTFYSGDLMRWRTRDPTKDVSFRKLSRHPDLPMSAAALYRSVCTYELCERLNLRSWRHISASHLRLVLPLSDRDQEKVLRTAEVHAWPVRRLDEEVAIMLSSRAELCKGSGGRKRDGRLRHAMRSVAKCSAALTCLLEASRDVDIEGSPESRRGAIELLQGTVDKCKILETRLKTPVKAKRDSASVS